LAWFGLSQRTTTVKRRAVQSNYWLRVFKTGEFVCKPLQAWIFSR
jgi:hypothetical protein